MKHHVSSRNAGLAIVLAACTVLLAACGGGEEAQDKAPARKAAKKAPAATEAPASAGADDKRLANAVVTGKTTAPVDLKYDVLAKPAVGQPVEVELTLLPRQPADVLEVEVTGMPGLVVVDGAVAKFEGVQGGGRHVSKVLVRADEAGLYYLGVAVRMVTRVQTEARTFSLPVVVGAAPAAEKAAPARDASGQPIESMPAQEGGASTGSKE